MHHIVPPIYLPHVTTADCVQSHYDLSYIHLVLPDQHDQMECGQDHVPEQWLLLGLR